MVDSSNAEQESVAGGTQVGSVAAIARAHVSNPLSLIAIFAGLSETAAIIALPILTGYVQKAFVWYVMFFPVLLVVLFFATLNFNSHKLYAPSDYASDDGFLKANRPNKDHYNDDDAATGSADRLAAYLADETDGPNHQILVRAWLDGNGHEGISLPFFQFSDGMEAARDDIIKELSIPERG